MATPQLSIIIPTSLGRIPWPLLHSINEQSLDSNLYEIILVFNGKIKPANTVPMTNAHLYYSPLKGVNHARNLGIVHARGDVLLFLDDDCRLHSKTFLSTVVEHHLAHPEQVSVGGPYVLPAKTSWLARAYHHNQSEWMRQQKCGEHHSRTLLGGNASYKKRIFTNGLRFSPGIIYGGSETPLNLEVFRTYGPHHFFDDLALEHQSRLTPWTFLKKAYLQGKGSAFQKKFYGTYATSLSGPKRLSFFLQFLLWIYDFCFMMGYRTSIYERRNWLPALGEELFQKLAQLWSPLLADIFATRAMAFSLHVDLQLSSSPPERSQTLGLAKTESLFERLQKTTERDLLHKSIRLAPGTSCDSIYASLTKIASHYSVPPESLSFASVHRAPTTLSIYSVGDFVFIFSPELSDNIQSWNRDRVEPSLIKAPVTYLFSENSKTCRKIWPQKLHPLFYPLDGVAIHKETWIGYLSQAKDPMNHFSWNQYVQSELPVPLRCASKVGAPLNEYTLQSHAQVAFLNQPSRSFYHDHMVLLGTNSARRSFLFRLFLWLADLVGVLPSRWTLQLSSSIQTLQNRMAHWQLEAQETSSLAYKWMAYVLHRSYWLLHKLFWKASEVYWFCYKIGTFVLAQIIWRTFDVLILFYMIFNTIYWRLHVLFIGPAMGFIVSLAEEPAHFRSLPFAERLKQRSLLFLRKWAWLILRGARLR